MESSVHIIYVGGTVDSLAPFLGSLLEQTSLQFRLVLNGCAEQERRTLEQYRRTYPDRIELRTVSDRGILRHGPLLDRLLEAETSDYFCILDSDIFATGPLTMADLVPGPDETATCGCLPVWHGDDDRVAPKDYSILAGRFLRTANGTFVGCTYAAAYRTEPLRRTMEKWGLSFRKYSWRDLPPAVRNELDRRDMRFRFYDTAKVVNILLDDAERSMVYRDLPNLVHLGAQSGPAAQVPGVRRFVREFALARSPAVMRLRWQLQGIGADERHSLVDLSRRRRDAAQIFAPVNDPNGHEPDRPEWLSAEAARALDTVIAPPAKVDLS